jgi:hypothetical protein
MISNSTLNNRAGYIGGCLTTGNLMSSSSTPTAQSILNECQQIQVNNVDGLELRWAPNLVDENFNPTLAGGALNFAWVGDSSNSGFTFISTYVFECRIARSL